MVKLISSLVLCVDEVGNLRRHLIPQLQTEVLILSLGCSQLEF